MRRQPPEIQRCRRHVLTFSLLLSIALAIPSDVIAQGGMFSNGSQSNSSENDCQGLFGFRGSTTVGLSNQGFGATNGLFGFQGFGGTDGDIDNQGFGGFQGGITNQGFGEEVPLNGGMLVLLMMAAGYASAKSKRKTKQKQVKQIKKGEQTMKRINIIMIMLALVMGMTQCKKSEELPVPVGGDSVTITLDVKSNNTKADVDPSTGLVNFESGDQIHVASGGKYVGTLTYNGTVFTGAIANAVEGSPLQFYFLGNITPAETLTSGVTETCSVVISDQTTYLPVISAAPSYENYTASNASYTAHLLNKCALVKFNVTTASSAATCIAGLNNKMTVSFSENTFTPSKEGNGAIRVAAGNGEKWAILLPQPALEAGAMESAYSEDFTYTGTRGAVPAIVENGYLTVGIPVFVATEVNQGGVFPGAINGKFTINADGDQVYFSQGNLQYQASTGTWRFAENQYDYVGNANSNISSTYDGWIDLFGWGTSGWNNGNTYYQPWDYQNNGNSSQGYGYGPTDGTCYEYNLTDTYANADWGVYNAISNGGNVPNQWRALTNNEWYYVINTRSPLSGIRFAKAVVNGVNGIVILPDNWNPAIYELNNANESGAAFIVNVITFSDWSIIESNGAVFLPAAGYRNINSLSSIGSSGLYWSVSGASTGYAKDVIFSIDNFSSSRTVTRFGGRSVRLVRSAD